ncbi:hypothetical protein R3P38DRAFT_3453702 [Favolaschia claudopus]|uniref:Uncharacterized protein n=1 Tax=Favolaschia claudopus TaxID=2862362 RepID=A0AAW0CN75_9AGAR
MVADFTGTATIIQERYLEFLTTTATTTSAVPSGTPSHSLPQPVPAAASSNTSSVVAFTGLARPSTASVQQARQASIQRNLHGSGPSTSALTPTSPSKKKRKSGPPRSYTDIPASSAALNDFAVTSAPTSATIWCGILPKVLDSSDFNDPLDLSPRIFWKSAEEIENAQMTLKNAHLVFTVDVSTTGPIFEAIEIGFQSHCATNNIDYVAPTSSAAVPSPNTMSYVLLGPRGRSNGRTWIEDPKSLTRFTFTLQALRSAPYSHTPNNLGDGVFVFLAPRHRNLFAPIDCLFGPTSRLPDHVLPHRCFGQRVLHSIVPSLSGDPDPVCGKAYTTLTTSTSEPEVARSVSPEIFEVPDSDDEFPDMLIDSVAVYQSDNGTESHSGLAASTQSARTIITRAAARQQWQEQAAAAAVPISNVAIFVPGPLLFRVRISDPRPQSTSLSNTCRALDPVIWWLGKTIFSGRGTWTIISFTASSVDEGARALIALCFWLCSHPTSLKLKEVLTEQFASPRPKIDNAHLGNKGLFGLRARISHTSLGLIKRIVGGPLDAPMYSSQGEYCEEYQYLLNIPGVDPSMISTPRSKEEQQGVAETVVSFTTLGCVDIEHHPDFLGTGDGFNVIVEPFGGQTRRHHILEVRVVLPQGGGPRRRGDLTLMPFPYLEVEVPSPRSTSRHASASPRRDCQRYTR